MKKYLINIIIGIVLIGIGSTCFIFEMTDFNYTNTIDSSLFDKKTEEKEIILSNKKLFIIGDEDDIKVTINDNMKDKVLIKYTYFSDFIKPKITNRETDDYMELYLYYNNIYNNIVGNQLFKKIKEDFKKRTISNYSLLYKLDVEIVLSSYNRNMLNLKIDD